MAQQPVSMREYVDVRINELNANVKSVQTKAEADMSNVKTELKSIDDKLGGLPGTVTIISVVATAAVALLTIIFGAMALMGDRFDAGLGFNSSSIQQAQEAAKTSVEAKKASEKTAQDIEAITQKYKAIEDLSQKWNAQSDR